MIRSENVGLAGGLCELFGLAGVQSALFGTCCLLSFAGWDFFCSLCRFGWYSGLRAPTTPLVQGTDAPIFLGSALTLGSASFFFSFLFLTLALPLP